VADIIKIDDKLQLSKTKKAALARHRKILAVQKVFHCTHCASKCAKCGTQISMAQYHKNRHIQSNIPYRFCESCLEEYADYIERLQGRGERESYWHNEAWLDVWRKWIDYQGTIDRYLKSKEFVQLINEIRETSFEK